MRAASNGLKALLASRAPCHVADLFTWTLANGAVYRWSSFDRSLSVGGNIWLGTGPLLTRNRFAVKNTVEVPELEVRLAAGDSTLVNGQNIKEQIHNGIFDGARVELDRVFMPTPGDNSLGTVLLFNGRQSGAVIDAEGVTLTAKGDNVLMNQQAPRNLYQITCLHSFCDAGCTLAPAAYTITGNVGSSSAPSSSFVPWASAPANAALFTLGKLTMTSGAAVGQIRTVRLANASGLFLTYPLYDLPAAGDSFSLLMGCDRQQTSCQTRTTNTGAAVNNILHFRGYPYVPVAELAF
ncbi:MAG TPA: DUF2163 domain-containing protein [Rhizomicrobium sp.]